MRKLSSLKTYETADDFYEDADWPMFALRDAEYSWWLVWCTEDGDWYAVRPMTEDDTASESDPNRPVGPTFLDRLKLPWQTVALDSLDFPDDTDETPLMQEGLDR